MGINLRYPGSNVANSQPSWKAQGFINVALPHTAANGELVKKKLGKLPLREANGTEGPILAWIRTNPKAAMERLMGGMIRIQLNEVTNTKGFALPGMVNRASLGASNPDKADAFLNFSIDLGPDHEQVKLDGIPLRLNDLEEANLIHYLRSTELHEVEIDGQKVQKTTHELVQMHLILDYQEGVSQKKTLALPSLT